MARGAVIGALRVNLGLDSAQFSRGARDAQSISQRLTRAIRVGFAAAAAAATAALASIAAGIRSVIADADNIAKMSQRLGIASDALIRLRYAAQLSGVEFSSLRDGVTRLNTAITQGVTGVSNDATKALAALGVQLRNTDGSLKTSDQVMADLAARFAQYRDGAEKSALAAAIFGRRAGPEMIPLLNQGAEALERTNREAEQFGLIMSTRLQAASERFNDNMSRMWSILRGVFTQVAEHVVPIMARLTYQFIDWVRESNAVERWSGYLTTAFNGLARVVTELSHAWELLGATVRMVGGMLRDFGTLNVEGSIKTMENYLRQVDDIEKRLAASVERLRATMSGDDRPLTIPGRDRPAAPTIPGAGTGGGRRGGRNALADKMRREAEAIEREGQRITRAMMTPLERYEAHIERISMLLEKKAISQETADRAMKAAAVTMREANPIAQALSRTLQQQFTSIFEGLVTGAMKARDAIRQLLTQLARLLINQAFMRLFSLGGPLGGLLGGIGGLLGGGIPGRASGGPITAGRPYMVGERGPELVIPNSSGTVISNRDLMRGGVQQVAITLDVNPSGEFDARVAETSRAVAVRVVGQNNKQIPALVANSQRRGTF